MLQFHKIRHFAPALTNLLVALLLWIQPALAESDLGMTEPGRKQEPTGEQPIQPEAPIIEVVQVTAVKANPTDQGVEVILQTPKGKQLQVVNRSTSNSFIVDIPNAQLRLPSGEEFVFRSQKPITGVTEITVTNFNINTIRVTVTSEAGIPTVKLFDSEEGLIFGVVSAAASAQQEQPGSETIPEKPSAEGEEEIEIVVTGEQETGYGIPDAATATRTDTPLRDIPQSIQVVPRQVIRETSHPIRRRAQKRQRCDSRNEYPHTQRIYYSWLYYF